MNPSSSRSAPARVAAVLFLLVVLLFGAVRAVLAQEARAARKALPSPVRELYLFFSPAEKSLAGEIRALAKVLARHPEVELRPVFLTDDWNVLKKPGEHFARTIKELRALRGVEGGIRVWDDEGLSLARELGIGRLPAFAVLDAPDRAGTRKAKVAVGYGAKVEELLQWK